MGRRLTPERIRARMEPVQNVINKFDWLPPTPEGSDWPGLAEVESFRLPAAMTDYFRAIADETGLKLSEVRRLALDIGLDQIRQSMPEKIRRKLDKKKE